MGSKTELPVLVRVQTGEDGASRRAADRLRNVSVLEQHTLRGKGVNVRRLDHGIAIAGQFTPVILAHDQQDVWAVGVCVLSSGLFLSKAEKLFFTFGGKRRGGKPFAVEQVDRGLGVG